MLDPMLDMRGRVALMAIAEERVNTPTFSRSAAVLRQSSG